MHPGQFPNTFLLIVSGRTPSFNLQCLRPQTNGDDLPIPGSYRGNTSPYRSRLQVKQRHAHSQNVSVHTPSVSHLVSWSSPALAFLCQTQASLDARPSSVSSMTSASWVNTTSAGTATLPGIMGPAGRRGKLIYSPMILVDEATGNSQPLWSDGSASLPAGSRAPGWYPGQTRTFGSMRMPPINQGFLDKGSADSLVESVSNNVAGNFCE